MDAFTFGKAKLSIKISSIKLFFVNKTIKKNEKYKIFILLNSANFAEPENTNFKFLSFKQKSQNKKNTIF